MPSAAEKQRRCIASGEVKPASELIRFVVGPDGELVPDLAGRLPGRGLWVSARRGALERALAKCLFAKGFKHPVRTDADLALRLDRLLAASCLSLLSLARRAGELDLGFEKVRQSLRSRDVAVLLGASDSANDGRDKLSALARAVPGGEVVIVETFERAELSLALGRENVVHAAVKHGGLASRFCREWRRLASYRRIDGRADQIWAAGQ